MRTFGEVTVGDFRKQLRPIAIAGIHSMMLIPISANVGRETVVSVIGFGKKRGMSVLVVDKPTVSQEEDVAVLEEMMRAFYNSPPSVPGIVWPTLAQALRFGFYAGMKWALVKRDYEAGERRG